MSESYEERGKNIEADKDATLSALIRLVELTPNVPRKEVEKINQAIEDAQAEIREQGKLSQTTAENLEDLHRQFKRDFVV